MSKSQPNNNLRIRKKLSLFASLFLFTICQTTLGQLDERPENMTRRVLKARPQAQRVGLETMQRIYDEVKTPFKYGIILKGEEGRKVDCPSVFRRNDRWYMIYTIFDGTGYETAIAESNDLLNFKLLGKILSFREGTWDARQAAGYIALQDHNWGGSYELQKYQGKYWLSYIGGALKGYETDPLAIGIAWTSDPTKPVEWNRLVLQRYKRFQ